MALFCFCLENFHLLQFKKKCILRSVLDNTGKQTCTKTRSTLNLSCNLKNISNSFGWFDAQLNVGICIQIFSVHISNIQIPNCYNRDDMYTVFKTAAK